MLEKQSYVHAYVINADYLTERTPNIKCNPYGFVGFALHLLNMNLLNMKNS